MRKYLGFISAVLAVFLLLSATPPPAAASDDYVDIAGHWAEPTMRKASDDGLIVGFGGFLSPNQHITAAQVLTIICRILGATEMAYIAETGLPASAWFFDDVAKAAHLGLISLYDEQYFNSPIPRQEVFYLIAEAFQLAEADPDMSVLEQFTDSYMIDGAKRRALASLVSQGLLSGYGGALNVNGNTTRAEFLAVIYRIVGEFIPSGGYMGEFEHGVIARGPAYLSQGSFRGGIWFDCSASEVSLYNVYARNAVIRSHSLSSLVIDGSTRIGRLTLAAQSGDVTVYPAGDSVVDTLLVGSGGGLVTVNGIGTVEITGDGRSVTLADSAEIVIVAGQDNRLYVPEGVEVGRIKLLRGAYDSHVVVNGNVGELEMANISTTVDGQGLVDTLSRSPAHTGVLVNYSRTLDTIDYGLDGASVSINMPGTLPPGNSLRVGAAIAGAAQGLLCDLAFYIDGVLVKSATITTGDALPALTYDFEYSRDMPERSEVRVVIRYTTLHGERQEISATGTVRVENFDRYHWMRQDAQRVLPNIDTGYRGDFTLQWALQNDFDDNDKEVWINAKDYSSGTGYLLWINITYQRVNVFAGAAGSWELIHTFLVATGAPSTPTEPGVTTTTYKQVDGWTTASYTVRPVVRFKEGTGYAFHSRLLYPRSDTVIDGSIGFPVSHGCIRMYCDDIWWIYNNIPNGTTVVIF